MSMSCRSFSIFARILAAAALVVAGMQAAIAQGRGKGPQALTHGQELRFTAPQFVVHALWFKSNDETNWAWQGSDEVYAVFSDMDPTHGDRVTSIYGNVDEGDTETFGTADTCMAPQQECNRGMISLNVRFSFWDSDGGFPYGDIVGGHYWLQQGTHSFDDLIGRGSIIHSREDLVAMLPDVGASREFTSVMDKDAGKYRFRYRITRLPDVTRSIIIHLPPDLGMPPTITLQATVASFPQGSIVSLSWSGATTSTVDIYRNGVKVTTTANDGAQNDGVVSGTYQYRLCNLGSTTACSAPITVVAP